MSTQNIGNIMTRLAGLKNVSGRRAMREPPLLLDEEEEADVSGTAQPLPNFSAFQDPNANMPEPDLGAELTPQSYDVRANVVNTPEEEQGFFAKLGKALGQYVDPQRRNQAFLEGARNEFAPIPAPEAIEHGLVPPTAPPIETEQVDIAEGLPPVTPSQEMAIESPEMAAPQTQMPQAPIQSETGRPEAKEPGTYVEPGAVQDVYGQAQNSPELNAEIERIFQTQITPERIKEANEFETVVNAFMNKLEGVETALTAREKALLAKVENRDLSASEQISMALALIAPALIGGLLAGKEGLAGGLAAGGQNVGNVLAAREKEFNEAQELLPEIALQKSNIAKEKLATSQETSAMKKKIMESGMNPALKELFSQDGEVLNGKLVLNSGNELLPIKSTAIRSKDDYDRIKKEMPEFATKVATTQQGLKALDELQQLIDYGRKAREGGGRNWARGYDTIALIGKAYIPASRDTFIDEDGNEVKISELFNTIREQAADAYGQTLAKAGAQANSQQFREHVLNQIPNPFTKEALKAGQTGLGTITAQIKGVKNKFEDNAVTQLDSAGFDTYPIKQYFKTTKITSNKSEEKRKENRANSAATQVINR